MNYPHGSNHDDTGRAMDEPPSRMAESLRDRAARARDIVENVRERAEETFRDKPYLLPVAAGALGLGVGLLLGSKLTRFIAFTAVGMIVTETFGGELRRLGRALTSELQKNLGQGAREEGDGGEPSSI
jgi:hypothetical protein